MTTRTITPTQLRGMIKEALEESVVELQLDEQIEALKAKGTRRNLQENKRYRRLLEAKMEMLSEDEKEDDFAFKGKAAFIAKKFGEGTPLGKAMEDAASQPVVQRVQLLADIAEALGFDTTGEMSKLFAEIKDRVREHQAKMRDKSATESESELLGGLQLSLPGFGR
jgi:hypothetical protein